MTAACTRKNRPGKCRCVGPVGVNKKFIWDGPGYGGHAVRATCAWCGKLIGWYGPKAIRVIREVQNANRP